MPATLIPPPNFIFIFRAAVVHLPRFLAFHAFPGELSRVTPHLFLVCVKCSREIHGCSPRSLLLRGRNFTFSFNSALKTSFKYSRFYPIFLRGVVVCIASPPRTVILLILPLIFDRRSSRERHVYKGIIYINIGTKTWLFVPCNYLFNKKRNFVRWKKV